MYNVEADKEFVFNFKSDMSSVYDAVTVHTDIKVKEESKIHFKYSNPIIDGTYDNNKVVIAPASAVLGTADDYGTWGNAPIYYLSINYDMNSETLKKLENPIVVPFTISSEVEVPNLRYEISKDGRLELTWDKIEGADSYKVYNVGSFDLDTNSNKPISGAESGYKGFPQLVGEVKDTRFDDFLKNGYGGLTNKSEEETIVYQNQGVTGDYYVTAVKDGKESNFSLGVSTAVIGDSLPKDLIDKINFTTYESLESLPSSVKVSYNNGSEKSLPVIYDIENAKNSKINFVVSGTAFKGYVEVKNLEGKVVSNDSEDILRGVEEVTTETKDVPTNDVPTIIEKENDKKDSKKDSKKEEEIKDVPSDLDKNNIEEQRENTKEIIEEANKEEVVVPDLVEEYPIYADSAFEEYLAIQLINGNDKINLSAFPESQNMSTLKDTLLKVMYQNPLIMGMDSFSYDYSSLTLEIHFEESFDVMKKQQEEIIKEAKKVIKEIIKPGMSDDEKRLAIYDYLNDNTIYNFDALESAEANNFQDVDDSFNNSFTTYGILVEKVGVCQSYALTYKLLADLAGLESVVITGDIGGLPHAWNKVKIDDEWYHVDTTNNETNVGYPYMYYNISDETAENNNLIENDEYWIDNELSNFSADDSSLDYYVVNDLFAKSTSDIEKIFNKLYSKDSKYIVFKVDDSLETEDIINTVGSLVHKNAPEKLDSTLGFENGEFFKIQFE